MTSRHFSLRIDESLSARLDSQAREIKQTSSELARELIDEGLRMRRHHGILFRDGPTGRRAGLADGPDVWEVMDFYFKGEGSHEERIAWMEELTSVNRYQIARAIQYYDDFRDEIDERIALNAKASAEGYARFLAEQEIASR
jgi:hypothetical protein